MLLGCPVRVRIPLDTFTAWLPSPFLLFPTLLQSTSYSVKPSIAKENKEFYSCPLNFRKCWRCDAFQATLGHMVCSCSIIKSFWKEIGPRVNIIMNRALISLTNICVLGKYKLNLYSGPYKWRTILEKHWKSRRHFQRLKSGTVRWCSWHLWRGSILGGLTALKNMVQFRKST